MAIRMYVLRNPSDFQDLSSAIEIVNTDLLTPSFAQ